LIVFWIDWAQKKDREGGERPNEAMAVCDGLQKKREASGNGTRLRSIGLQINRPHKKEKEGRLRSIDRLLD